MLIKVKWIYEEPKKSDGLRIFVDKLWPRGIKKDEANIDLWLKDIAPSDVLRKWFNHEPKKWPEFQTRYAKELINKEELTNKIQKEIQKRPITLLFSAKDLEHNNAVALRNFLLAKL